MPSSQDYATRIRAAVHKELTDRISRLDEELRTFRSNLSASLGQIEGQMRGIEPPELIDAEPIIAEAIAEADRQHKGELASLARFALDIQMQETQEEILGALLDAAHTFSPRLALFISRGREFAGWASRGYPEAISQQISSGTFAQSESPMLEKALQAASSISIKDFNAESKLQQLIGGEEMSSWHAFPMKALRRPVSVLLAADVGDQASNLQALALLLAMTQLRIENLALRIMGEMAGGRTAGAIPRPVPPAESVQLAGGQPVPSLGITQSGVARELRPEAHEPAEAAPFAADEVVVPEKEAPSYEPGFLPQPARGTAGPVACREEPVVSPIEAAKHDEIAATGPAAAAIPAATPPQAKPAAPEEVQRVREEEKLHADAKRFARLLVSEIKLYNEQRVLEGRKNRDLYVRLKRDVDRSREMYEKRVAQSVARKVDYFHDEIIRILGDNDPSTLGQDYPGPRSRSES